MGRRRGTLEVAKRISHSAIHDKTAVVSVEMTLFFCWVGVSLEPYAVFADDGEYGEEVGEAEELPDSLADMEELHLASCGAG